MPRPAPPITPVNVSCAPVTLTLLLAPNVIAPANELVPVLVASVPPLFVMPSAVAYATLRRSSVVPAASVVPPATVPSALFAVTASVPPLTVVVPV